MLYKNVALPIQPDKVDELTVSVSDLWADQTLSKKLKWRSIIAVIQGGATPPPHILDLIVQDPTIDEETKTHYFEAWIRSPGYTPTPEQKNTLLKNAFLYANPDTFVETLRFVAEKGACSHSRTIGIDPLALCHEINLDPEEKKAAFKVCLNARVSDPTPLSPYETLLILRRLDDYEDPRIIQSLQALGNPIINASLALRNWIDNPNQTIAPLPPTDKTAFKQALPTAAALKNNQDCVMTSTAKETYTFYYPAITKKGISKKTIEILQRIEAAFKDPFQFRELYLAAQRNITPFLPSELSTASSLSDTNTVVSLPISETEKLYFPTPPTPTDESYFELSRKFSAILTGLRKFFIERYNIVVDPYIGFVEPETADKNIHNGHLFFELSSQISLVSHGLVSHLIQWAMILSLVEGLSLDEVRALLQASVIKFEFQDSWWNTVIDATTIQPRATLRNTPDGLNAYAMFESSVLGEVSRTAYMWGISHHARTQEYLDPSATPQEKIDTATALEITFKMGVSPVYSEKQLALGKEIKDLQHLIF